MKGLYFGISMPCRAGVVMGGKVVGRGGVVDVIGDARDGMGASLGAELTTRAGDEGEGEMLGVFLACLCGYSITESSTTEMSSRSSASLGGQRCSQADRRAPLIALEATK